MHDMIDTEIQQRHAMIQKAKTGQGLGNRKMNNALYSRYSAMLGDCFLHELVLASTPNDDPFNRVARSKPTSRFLVIPSDNRSLNRTDDPVARIWRLIAGRVSHQHPPQSPVGFSSVKA